MNDDDPTSNDLSNRAPRFDERQLAELPPLDVAPERAAQIRRRAHAILRAEQSAPAAGSFAYLYQRSVEPALLIGVGVWQVLWAAHGTWQLLLH